MVLFKKKRGIDYLIYSLVIAVGIILDQLTKWLAVVYLSESADKVFIPDF